MQEPSRVRQNDRKGNTPLRLGLTDPVIRLAVGEWAFLPQFQLPPLRLTSGNSKRERVPHSLQMQSVKFAQPQIPLS